MKDKFDRWGHTLPTHLSFLRDELMAMVRKDPFVSRFRRLIGGRLWEGVDEDAVRNDGSFSDEPDFVFYWIDRHGGLTPEWMADKDGNYPDDDGELYLQPIPPSIPKHMQMAAYGLFKVYLDTFDWDYLFLDEEGENISGFKLDVAIGEQAQLMLEGYKSLVYAQRLQHGGPLNAAEEARSKTFDFAKLGAEGGRKRHASMAKLEEWTIKKYREGNWTSINKAAHALQNSVINHGRTINATLSPSNAQRTIQRWISESKKESAAPQKNTGKPLEGAF